MEDFLLPGLPRRLLIKWKNKHRLQDYFDFADMDPACLKICEIVIIILNLQLKKAALISSLYQRNLINQNNQRSIFIFIKKEIFLAWIVGPYIFQAFIYFTFVFQFL